MQTLTELYSLNCRGRLLELDKPLIMGILNLTPDSFSDGGRFNEESAALRQAENMLAEGADILDLGGYSSRPKADHISPGEELKRVEKVLASILRHFPEAIISIDTFRPEVARSVLDIGAHIINDISAGRNLYGEEAQISMFELLASYPDVPYIMMHMQGNPQNMQRQTDYEDVVESIWDFFVERINQAREAGLRDIILDPGFGFGKEILHNYQIMGSLDQFSELNLPLLVGVSRKSMLYKLFETTPTDVVEMASILHFKALEKGAHILRVHDVKEAVRTVRLFQYFLDNGII